MSQHGSKGAIVARTTHAGLPAQAEIFSVGSEVSNVPTPDSGNKTKEALFDDVVGNCEYAGRNRDAKRLGSLHVNGQLEFGRLQNRQICRLPPR